MKESARTVIFDLDGTLIPNTSAEKTFFFYLLRNRILSVISIIQHFDSDKTVLYANTYADRYVMNAVERPIAVNPDKKFLNYALRTKWRIIEPWATKVSFA